MEEDLKEIKDMLKALLHRADVTDAKLDGLQASVDRIEGTLSRHEKRLDSYRSRIAAVEEQLSLFGQLINEATPWRGGRFYLDSIPMQDVSSIRFSLFSVFQRHFDVHLVQIHHIRRFGHYGD